MLRFADFIATKRGMARGLNSKDPAYSALPVYFFSRLGPAFQMLLLDAAVESKAIRPGFKANELLQAVAALGRGGHCQVSLVRLSIRSACGGSGTSYPACR